MLILGCAPLLAATVYMTLSRIIRGLGAEDYSIMRTRWVSKIYITIDIASFMCQIMGTAASASGAEGARQGMKIVLGGLGIQLVAFAVFILMTVVLHRRLLKMPTGVSERQNVPWERAIWTLYTVSGLITIRSVFRFIEFAEGGTGTISRNEALMYVFDATLLFLAAVCFAIVHPGILFKSIERGEHIPLSGDDTVPLRHYNK
jgi:tellurite resistance protein TehA-like permease